MAPSYKDSVTVSFHSETTIAILFEEIFLMFSVEYVLRFFSDEAISVHYFKTEHLSKKKGIKHQSFIPISIF